jgi:energy-coupling factor transport system permease protein
MIAGVGTALVTYDPVALAAISVVVLAVAASAGMALPLARTMVGFAPLAASILLVQVLVPAFCSPSCTVAATIGPVTLYAEGVAHGLALVMRLLTIELVAFLGILTTRAPDVLASLTRLRLPPSVAFSAAISLQLVPGLRRDLRIVLDAQRARGLRAAGPTALVRALVPVIVASVERVQQLSISIEARGFGSSTPRSSYREVAFGRRDGILAALGLAAAAVGVFVGLTRWGAASVTWPVMPASLAILIVAGAAVAFIGAVARGLRFVASA